MIACQLGWPFGLSPSLAFTNKQPRFHLVKWLVEFEGVDIDGPMSRCGFRAIDYAGKASAFNSNYIDLGKDAD